MDKNVYTYDIMDKYAHTYQMWINTYQFVNEYVYIFATNAYTMYLPYNEFIVC